jgi:hypothetical protein
VLQNHLDGEMNFAQEIEKLPVTNFSVVELVFKYEQHVYGAFVLQFLQLPRIRTATKKLKVYQTFCREVILFHVYSSSKEYIYMSSVQIFILGINREAITNK